MWQEQDFTMGREIDSGRDLKDAKYKAFSLADTTGSAVSELASTYDKFLDAGDCE